jgi:hypothetical protein
MPRIEDPGVAVVGREARDAVGSFCGGAGGVPCPAAGVAAPKGPNGSSTASRRVGWAPNCRLRGPRAAGERGAAEAFGAVLSDALEEERDSRGCESGAFYRRSSTIPDSWLSSFTMLGVLCDGLDREGTSSGWLGTWCM